MPSPVGHALGGLAAGWLVDRPRTAWWRSAAVLATAAMLPDIDLLWGAHHQATHSLAAVVVAWVVASTVLRLAPDLRTVTPGPWALAAAYGSHILLDLLGADSTPPIGVMLVWPFNREYVIAPWPMFPAISRRYWLPGFWAHNLRALAFELAVLGPIAATVWTIRRRTARGS